MRVLDPDHPLGIRTAALWLIEGAHKYAYYAYAPSGHSEHLEKLLEGYKLVSVMCDGSYTNNCVDRAGGSRGGCNSHSRRGLVDALRRGDERALAGLEFFAGIFHVDAVSMKAGESLAERHIRRQQESRPLVEQLRAWIDARLLDVEPKTPLGDAVRYIHRQWKRLTLFLRDPLMELTNNEVERDLRRWVLDRRTWLFCGHDVSARRAADALTIITTCRKHGIDPRRYFRDTLTKLLDGEKHLSALLPEAYAAAMSAPAAESATAA
jgi:transposase